MLAVSGFGGVTRLRRFVSSSKALKDRALSVSDLINWNTDPTRTKEEVISLMDQLIEEAKTQRRVN